MKKIFIILSISIFVPTLIIGAMIYYKRQQSQKYPLYDTSMLPTVTVNGKQYKTTGAIPAEDVNAIETLKQVIKLSRSGPLNTANYRITTQTNGDVLIYIYPPYESSKQESLKWLKDNGFDKLDESYVTFIETAK